MAFICRMFGRSLAANLEMHWGRTGANHTMLRLCEEAWLAFDWHHLALRTPTREHYLAVLRHVELLEPMLRRTLWPPAPAFPHVRRAWPAQRGANGWFRQFQLLALRVRNKATYLQLVAAGAGGGLSVGLFVP